MSTLRRFKSDPFKLLNNALLLYKSKKILTAIVEGTNDKRFLTQWLNKSDEIRFDGMEGKELVELAYAQASVRPFAGHDFLYFFADVDYDDVSSRQLYTHPCFVYNAYCFESDQLFFNDLEGFLVNSRALGKVLANYDVDNSEVEGVRQALERASRTLGAFRAADEVIRTREKLKTTVLNGLGILDEFFNADRIEVDKAALMKAIPRWALRKEFLGDLFDEANSLNDMYSNPWALSRGHDVTEMLALHLEKLKGFKVHPAEVESKLRMACEREEFLDSPMGKQILLADTRGIFSRGSSAEEAA